MRPRSRSWLVVLASLPSAAAAMAAPLPPGPDDAPVRTTVVAIGEAWHNARGGSERGRGLNSLVDVRIELAGPAVGAPDDGLFAAHVHWVDNEGGQLRFPARTGAFAPVSAIMAEDHVRVFNLHYRQVGANGRWAFKVGQIAVDDDFMLSEYSAVFLNSSLGAMPSQVATPLSAHSGAGPAFAVFDVAAPGAWMHWHLSETCMWQTAVYHGGPGLDTHDNHGFSWISLDRAGVATFSELSWQQTVRGHATTFRVGVAGHTGHFDDFSEWREGREREVRGLFSAYAVQDLALVVEDGGRTRLGAFARLGVCPSHRRAAVRTYGDAGVVWHGPLPLRPEDALGVAVSMSRFGDAFRELNGLAARETVVELTYRAAVTHRLAVQADAQLLRNPAPDAATGERRTALVVGVRATATF